MPSVMHYLMSTLPIAALGHHLATRRGHKDRERAIREASADELRRHLEWVPPRISRRMEPLRAEVTRQEYAKGNLPRIWAFESGPLPDRVGLGAVRVREMNLNTHVVFDSIQWGTAADNRRVVPAIEVMTERGTTLRLPLEDRFLYSQWWIRYPLELPEGAMPLFPLKNPLNVGLVRSFLYQQAGTGEVEPLDAARLTDEEVQEWRETDDAMRGLELGEAREDANLGRALFRHNALGGLASAGMAAAIGDERGVRVRGLGQRFLVTVSLSLGRDVTDFEPAGALVAARIHPHVHFVSTVPCQTVKVACHVRRPSHTRILDQYGGEPGGHHGACREMRTEVRHLLVADANDAGHLVYHVPAEVDFTGLRVVPSNFNPAPQWGNLFAYYCADASERFPGRSFSMIDMQSTARRAEYLCVVRQPPRLRVPLLEREGVALRKLRTNKEPRQGEFDNVHMAPRMFLEATHARLRNFNEILERDWVKVDPVALRLDEIAMAPLCAHDCFHSHWRWADSFTRSSVYGWDMEGPHRVAGAPMIPLTHSLNVMLPARHEVIFAETAHEISPGRQEVFFHFGAAYGLAADGLRSVWNPASSSSVSPATASSKGSPWEFGVEVDGTVRAIAGDSWAAMYWGFRYFLKEGILPRKTVELEEYHDAVDLLRAMES